MVDPGIFKAYDVRGLYGEQIDEAVAYRIGRAFPRVLAEETGSASADLTIGLGRDMRITAPALAAAYREGMLDSGASVLEIGEVGTEMLYFAVGSRGLDGGLMCTASHNPKPYTGAKLVRRGAIALSGDSGIGELRRIVVEGADHEPAAGPRGGHAVEDVAGEFRQAALRFIDPAKVRSMKVVLDGGNGMAGPMVGPILDGLPLEQVRTYWEPDGNFPDHEPNPLLPENRAFVVKKVLSEGAELGIAWDGDADRCFFIDDQGQFVDGDFLTALLAESVLSKEPGASILYDVRASRAVPDTVTQHDGEPYLNRVGHAFFKTRMRDEGAAFGGEVSGHYYFRDFYCADSGTIPALLILELLSVTGKRMSELLAPFRERYFISGEINSEVADQDGRMRELADRYSDGEVSWLDGVSVDYADWHFNVRPSNTEPLLRLNLESLVSPDHMAAKRDEAATLPRLLDALSRQTLANSRFEVVIIDDGSRDATAETAGRRAFARVVRMPASTGAAAARNCGIEASRAELLAFTDADCIPDATWLARGIARMTGGAAGLAAGRIDIPLGARPSLAALVDAATHLDQEHYAAIGFGATANLWARRQVFERVGGFNPRLFPGEDEEFCHRALAAGVGLVYAPEVVVVHPPRERAGELARKAFLIGRGAARQRRYGAPASGGYQRFWTQPRSWLPSRRVRGQERLAGRPELERRRRSLMLAAGQYLLVKLPRAAGDLVGSVRPGS